MENSLFADGIYLDKKHFDELKNIKKVNYDTIYKSEKVIKYYSDTIRPMMTRIFERCLDDLKRHDEDSVIYRHHIDFVNSRLRYAGGAKMYLTEPPELIVADYIASMSDSYFLELYSHLFGIRVNGYFDGI